MHSEFVTLVGLFLIGIIAVYVVMKSRNEETKRKYNATLEELSKKVVDLTHKLYVEDERKVGSSVVYKTIQTFDDKNTEFVGAMATVANMKAFRFMLASLQERAIRNTVSAKSMDDKLRYAGYMEAFDVLQDSLKTYANEYERMSAQVITSDEDGDD